MQNTLFLLTTTFHYYNPHNSKVGQVKIGSFEKTSKNYLIWRPNFRLTQFLLYVQMLTFRFRWNHCQPHFQLFGDSVVEKITWPKILHSHNAGYVTWPTFASFFWDRTFGPCYLDQLDNCIVILYCDPCYIAHLKIDKTFASWNFTVIWTKIKFRENLELCLLVKLWNYIVTHWPLWSTVLKFEVKFHYWTLFWDFKNVWMYYNFCIFQSIRNGI